MGSVALRRAHLIVEVRLRERWVSFSGNYFCLRMGRSEGLELTSTGLPSTIGICEGKGESDPLKVAV
jgi:hypothetical protein